jgi:protein-S-isoprenylcysteine O-methyltransferase Ste14
MSLLIPPPLVMVMFGAAMWGLSRFLPEGHISFSFQVPMAIALLVVGGFLIGISVASLVLARTTVNPLKPSKASSLVTDGVFGISRNPIYVGDLFILAALVVWLGNLLNIVLLVVFAWYITTFQIQPEERALSALFKEQYSSYCSRVRRWL